MLLFSILKTSRFYFKGGNNIWRKNPRVVSPGTVASVRKNFCQYCGRYQEEGLHNHHIKSKGAGGGDTEENLVTLCFECHAKTHSGELQLSVDKIITDELPGVDLILQYFIDGKIEEENCKWEQSALLIIMHEGLRMPVKDIASETGLSSSMIRQMMKTYNAFNDKSMRVPELSFYHHRIAAIRTDDPHKWIALAADNHWSTRQMIEEIKKSACETKESEKEQARVKTEKALRVVVETLERDDEVSEWLYGELEGIFHRVDRRVS